MTTESARVAASEQFVKDWEARTNQIVHQYDVRLERANRRITKVVEQHERRTLRIQTEAGRRGMGTSTIVLQQLDRAMSDHVDAVNNVNTEINALWESRNLALQRLAQNMETRIEAAAQRLMTESSRANVAAANAISSQRSRALRDFIAYHNLRNNVDIHILETIDQAIFDEFVLFLTQMPLERAMRVVDRDGTFIQYLPFPQWDRLRRFIRERHG